MEPSGLSASICSSEEVECFLCSVDTWTNLRVSCEMLFFAFKFPAAGRTKMMPTRTRPGLYGLIAHTPCVIMRNRHATPLQAFPSIATLLWWCPLSSFGVCPQGYGGGGGDRHPGTGVGVEQACPVLVLRLLPHRVPWRRRAQSAREEVWQATAAGS